MILLDIARVSKSGYYKWLKNSDKPDKDFDDYLIVKNIFDRGRGKWGFRTIQMKLRANREPVMNHKKIVRIMKKYNLITKIRRTNPYKQIMKKSLDHRTVKNKLNREFVQKIPYKFFCTDITYLFFNHHLAYLSVIKDIASGEVISWELSRRIDMELVLGTVKKMEKSVSSSSEIMIHSDQGFHYTNPVYIDTIKGLNMIQSMSGKGSCVDNAPIESFFGHMKDEIDYKECKSFEKLREIVTDYMDYYNNDRHQWNLKKMTPVEYRKHLLVAS